MGLAGIGSHQHSRSRKRQPTHHQRHAAGSGASACNYGTSSYASTYKHTACTAGRASPIGTTIPPCAGGRRHQRLPPPQPPPRPTPPSHRTAPTPLSVQPTRPAPQRQTPPPTTQNFTWPPPAAPFPSPRPPPRLRPCTHHHQALGITMSPDTPKGCRTKPKAACTGSTTANATASR